MQYRGAQYSLVSQLVQAGKGDARPQFLDLLAIDYTMWSETGQLVDTTKGRAPATVEMRRLIPGWFEGMRRMVVGERRRFWIPSALGYPSGTSGHPSGALVIEVALLAIVSSAAKMPKPPAATTPPADALRDPSGVEYILPEQGPREHAFPTSADRVQILCRAWNGDGEQFFSTSKPIDLEVNNALPAWKPMLLQMTRGERRLIWAPEAMAFIGRAGSQPGWTLMELELVDVARVPPTPSDASGPPPDAEVLEAGGIRFHSRILRAASGDQPKLPDSVIIDFAAWSTKGTLVVPPYGKPTSLPVEALVPGLQSGVQAMRVGEKRRFWLPEALTFQGQDGSPRGMLVYDVELSGIGH